MAKIEKEFKTISEQINILTQRGLKIKDKPQAELFLLRNNYYRISGYSLTMRKDDVFDPSATFENIMEVYEFDQKIRSILFLYLNILETNFKSYFAHRLIEQHGKEAQFDETLFSNTNTYTMTMEKVQKLTEENKNFHLPIRHFQAQGIPIPFWAHIEIFTLGNASILFSIAPEAVKKAVACDFGFQNNKNGVFVTNSMRQFTNLRNQCAHSNRIYNKIFQQKPKLNKEQRKKLYVNNKGLVDDNHLFAYLLLLKQFLSKDDFCLFCDDLEQLSEKHPFVALRYYGFPTDWISILRA